MDTVRWNVMPESADWQSQVEFQQAVRFLNDGQLVSIPTETVYGLAADATNGVACARIFEAKGRPRFNPLISHVANYETALEHGSFDPNADKLARKFWPGPLTLVVPGSPGSGISELCSAGLNTIALRVPDAPMMQSLSSELNRPLAAPSANTSGRLSPTTGQDVLDDLDGRIAMVIDSGRTRIGLESTVVSCVEGKVALLRPGGIPRGDIEETLGLRLVCNTHDNAAPISPGMLESHYAPAAIVRLDADHVKPDEALLAFGPDLPEGSKDCRRVFNLSQEGNLLEAASRLFEGLRTLDLENPKVIAVMAIPTHGIGEAINDRLHRAAASRKR